MPYVEVWVDSECDGNCDSADKLKEANRRRDYAIQILLAGRPANEVVDALTRGDIPVDFITDDQLRAKYQQWKDGKLPGFEAPRKVEI